MRAGKLLIIDSNIVVRGQLGDDDVTYISFFCIACIFDLFVEEEGCSIGTIFLHH